MHDRHHKAYEKLLYLCKEEELSKRQHRRLRRHLRTCPSCKETMEAVRLSMQQLQSQLSAGADPLPSAGLHGRIMTAVVADAESRRELFYPVRQRQLSLAMAGVVLLLTGSFLFQEMSGVLKMQRFEQRLSQPPRPASSLAAISSLKKTVASRDLSRVRMSLAGQQNLVESIRPYLNLSQQTVRSVLRNFGSILPQALMSRITVQISGSTRTEERL